MNYRDILALEPSREEITRHRGAWQTVEAKRKEIYDSKEPVLCPRRGKPMKRSKDIQLYICPDAFKNK